MGGGRRGGRGRGGSRGEASGPSFLNRCSVPFPTPSHSPIYLSLVVEGFVCINKWGEVGGGCFAGGCRNGSSPACPPLSLSQKRERRGRGGEYIKGKEFVIYILYIENSFHILYTPLSLSCPSPSLWERGVRGGSGCLYHKKERKHPTPSPLPPFIYHW